MESVHLSEQIFAVRESIGVILDNSLMLVDAINAFDLFAEHIDEVKS